MPDGEGGEGKEEDHVFLEFNVSVMCRKFQIISQRSEHSASQTILALEAENHTNTLHGDKKYNNSHELNTVTNNVLPPHDTWELVSVGGVGREEMDRFRTKMKMQHFCI